MSDVESDIDDLRMEESKLDMMESLRSRWNREDVLSDDQKKMLYMDHINTVGIDSVYLNKLRVPDEDEMRRKNVSLVCTLIFYMDGDQCGSAAKCMHYWLTLLPKDNWTSIKDMVERSKEDDNRSEQWYDDVVQTLKRYPELDKKRRLLNPNSQDSGDEDGSDDEDHDDESDDRKGDDEED